MNGPLPSATTTERDREQFLLPVVACYLAKVA